MKTLKLTTADYLEFNAAAEKAKDLIQNPKTKIIGAYIAIGIYTGLRFSDLIKLDWSIFKKDSVTLAEQKTGKVRVITFSKNLLVASGTPPSAWARCAVIVAPQISPGDQL